MASESVPLPALPPSVDLAAWQGVPGDSSVLIADGHDIRVAVRGGQLQVKDGPPGQPRIRTIAKVPRTVERVLILAGHGMLTVEAVRWLAWANIPWTVLDTETSEIVAASGPRSSTDARLIRVQATAAMTPAALHIGRLLLAAKLNEQSDVLAKYLVTPGRGSADFIRQRAADIERGEDVTAFGGIEGIAADEYWSVWSGRVAVPFSPDDMLRVPAHWRNFAQRKSLNGAQPPNRDATDPVNAVLNYLYRVAETECMHACHAYGLSPVLGISHADKPGRDSMALDLVEVIRPACDAIALELFAPDGVIPYRDNKPAYFDRRWFTETREGMCRLVAPLTHQLASHAAELGALVMPYAREVAAILARNADAVVSIPKVPGVRKLGQIERKHSYPANRLRAGTSVTDVIPDPVWQQIKPLLPVPEKPKRGPRYSASPREIAACLTIRYVMRCPWKDVPMGSMVTVERWRKMWDETGVWDKAREIIEAHGHLAALAE